jgi:hypothetical protein
LQQVAAPGWEAEPPLGMPRRQAYQQGRKLVSAVEVRGLVRWRVVCSGANAGDNNQRGRSSTVKGLCQ